MTASEARRSIKCLHYALETFIGKSGDVLLRPEIEFLSRSLHEYPTKIAKFHMTTKAHKDPWKMQPIVCCVRMFMNDWSKWLDYWLQTLECFVPTDVKDSQQIINKMKPLVLRPSSLLFAADINSIYNNIETLHTIKVISWWLDNLEKKKQLPPKFPLEAVKDAMITMMGNNVFEWRDMYFLELFGTAIETPAAVMWTTIYIAYQEVHQLIPVHGVYLLYYKCFIKNIFGVWTGNVTMDWQAFCDDANTFGVLT